MQGDQGEDVNRRDRRGLGRAAGHRDEHRWSNRQAGPGVDRLHVSARRPRTSWARRAAEDLGGMEAFNREVAAGSSTDSLAVHPSMAQRWEQLRWGFRVLAESNREMGLSPEDADERTEAWLWTAVHRVFAAPVSALMFHKEEAAGADKKRHEETAAVFTALFNSDVTQVPPVPATPEEMGQGGFRPRSREEIVKAAHTGKCHRCGARDTTGKHFTAVCGASFDTEHNPLLYKSKVGQGWAAGRGGGMDGGMGGLRGSRFDQMVPMADVQAMIDSGIRAREDRMAVREDDRRGRRRSPSPPPLGRYRSRDPPRGYGQQGGQQGAAGGQRRG